MKDTKQWLLEAAVTLFTKNGFYSTTTRAIAELAGVNESTFFRIFRSKDALLSDLLYMMTPGPEDMEVSALTGGDDLRRDFEVFLYTSALLHIRHIPVFRLALHVDEIYDQPRFAKIQAIITYTGSYFQGLSARGLAADWDYFALAQHINALSLTKASEFIAGEAFGVPAQQSAHTFAAHYAAYFARMLATNH